MSCLPKRSGLNSAKAAEQNIVRIDMRIILTINRGECKRPSKIVTLAEKAANDGQPFDVVILDIRMPPGIDGVAAGSAIREMDPDVEIVFVSGYSDIPRDELERRVPPPMKLHCFSKPLSFMQLAEDVANMVKAH